MAVVTKWFGLSAKGQWFTLAADRIDWTADTCKCSLHTVAYVPNQDTHQYFSVATSEVAASGTYTAGGINLANKVVIYTAATNEVALDADDFSATSATITARQAIVRKDTGTAATSPMVGWVDFGADVSVTTGTFSIQWDPTGVFKAVAA